MPLADRGVFDEPIFNPRVLKGIFQKTKEWGVIDGA
jgi:hypothetical protein